MDRMELVDDSPWVVTQDWDPRTDKDVTWVETASGHTVCSEIRDVPHLTELIALVPEMLTVCRLGEVIPFLEQLVSIHEAGDSLVTAMKLCIIGVSQQKLEAAVENAEWEFGCARDCTVEAINEYDLAVEILGEQYVLNMKEWNTRSFPPEAVREAIAALEMRMGTDRGDVLMRLDEASKGRTGV